MQTKSSTWCDLKTELILNWCNKNNNNSNNNNNNNLLKLLHEILIHEQLIHRSQQTIVKVQYYCHWNYVFVWWNEIPLFNNNTNNNIYNYMATPLATKLSRHGAVLDVSSRAEMLPAAYNSKCKWCQMKSNDNVARNNDASTPLIIKKKIIFNI